MTDSPFKVPSDKLADDYDKGQYMKYSIVNEKPKFYKSSFCAKVKTERFATRKWHLRK